MITGDEELQLPVFSHPTACGPGSLLHSPLQRPIGNAQALFIRNGRVLELPQGSQLARRIRQCPAVETELG
jgi:hypothetical protein